MAKFYVRRWAKNVHRWEYLHRLPEHVLGDYVELPIERDAATFTALETLPWILNGYRPKRNE